MEENDKKQSDPGKRDVVHGIPIILNIGFLVAGAILIATILSLVLYNWRNSQLYNSEVNSFIGMTAETLAGRIVGDVSTEQRDEVSRIISSSLGGMQQVRDCLVVDNQSIIFYDMVGSREGKTFSPDMKSPGLEYMEAPIVLETDFGFGLDATKEEIGVLLIGLSHEDFLKAEHIRSHVTFAQNISRDISEAVEMNKFIEVRDFMGNMMGNRRNIAYAQLLHANGTILFYSDAELSEAEAQEKEGTKVESEAGRNAMEVSAEKQIIIQNYRNPGGEPILDIAVPVLSGNKKLGVVRVGYSMGEFQKEQERSKLIMAVAIVVFAFLGLAFSLLTSMRISKPVRTLAGAANSLAEGDLDQRVDIDSGGREMRELGLAFNHMIEGLKERDQVKDVFSRYVTKDVASKILKNEEGTHLGGERRRVTVMFADIRGFTSIAENMSPEEVISILNEYFEIMVDTVFKYEGTLDKFMGDCVMAVFGAPFYHGDDEERAVCCALEMQKEIEDFNNKRKREGKREIEVGIGINTGYAIAGNIGSSKRIEYTVIGDTVNLAARLQEMALAGRIIISQDTFKEIHDRVEIVAMDPVMVKGRLKPVSVYRLMDYIVEDDRRRYKRVQVEIPVRFKGLERGASFQEATANISGGGCLLISKSPVGSGEGVELEIFLDHNRVLKGIAGEVLQCSRHNQNTFHIRVEFLKISLEERDEIIKFVYDSLEKGAAEA